MATDAATRQRNLESSILFMQDEHAQTLKALHEEISKLQGRCTDLTFQLTMNGVNIEEGGTADSRMTEINDKLIASQSHNTLLESQLAEQEKKMKKIEHELRAQKKRHLDEKRVAEQTVSSLKAEVEAKGNNIAYLTTELHRLKLAKARESQEMSEEESSARIVQRSQPSHNHLPTPPRDLLTNSARMRQRGSHASTRPGVRRIATVSSSSGLPVTSSTETPDITPFISRDLDLSVSAVEVKKPVPLPPIAASSSALRDREVHRVVIANGGPLTRSSVPEVATLAVDQINNAGWKKMPPSHGCEYK